MRRYCAIEEVLNVYEPRSWYSIPGYRGYEVSNDHYVRSMKHFKKYPFGIMITPKNKGSNNPIFTLSNDNDVRISISLSEIIDLVNNNPIEVGYPRATIITNRSSRNLSIVKKKPSFSPDNKNYIHFGPDGITFTKNQ